MLNNTVKEFLLQAKRGNTALVIDGLYFAGWSAGEVFSFEDAFEYLSFFGASKKLVRSGLNDPLFNRQGRRNARYTLPSPTEVLSALKLVESPFKDELTGKAFANLAAYRQALHLTLLIRKPDEYSRRLLSKRLGVSRVTTLNYEHFINRVQDKIRIRTIPQFKRTLVTAHNIHELPLKVDKTVGNLWLESPRAPNQYPHQARLVRYMAEQWMHEGKAVYITQQLSNYYHVVDNFGDQKAHLGLPDALSV